MGLGASLITFSPNTTIKSADVNSNFSNLNTDNSFSGAIAATSITDSGTLTVSGITVLDNGNISTNGSGLINALLKSLGGGHTLTDWNAGFSSVTTGGTNITHGIHNTAGVATAPTAVIMTSGSTGTGVTFSVTGTNATTFTATSSTNVNAFWIAILI